MTVSNQLKYIFQKKILKNYKIMKKNITISLHIMKIELMNLKMKILI